MTGTPTIDFPQEVTTFIHTPSGAFAHPTEMPDLMDAITGIADRVAFNSHPSPFGYTILPKHSVPAELNASAEPTWSLWVRLDGEWVVAGAAPSCVPQGYTPNADAQAERSNQMAIGARQVTSLAEILEPFIDEDNLEEVRLVPPLAIA